MKNFLRVGDTLSVGEFVVSPSGAFYATVRADGTFAVCQGTGPDDPDSHQLWVSPRSGATGNYFAVLETGGNLSVYPGIPPTQGQSRLWAANGVFVPVADEYLSFTFPGTAFYAVVQDDGNFVVRRGSGPSDEGGRIDSGLIWQSGNFLPWQRVLHPGEVLNTNGQGRFWMGSASGEFVITMDWQPQRLYANWARGSREEVWSAGTDAHAHCFAVMQLDGNFCMYDGDGLDSQGARIWEAGWISRDSNATWAVLEDDCTLRGYDHWGPLWQVGFPPPIVPRATDPNVQAMINQISNILQNVTAPWPNYQGKPEQSAFDCLNASLPSITLWGDLEGVEEATVQSIDAAYRETHPEGTPERTAWDNVLVDVYAAIGAKDTLATFTSNLQKLGSDTIEWMALKLDAAVALIALDQPLVITVGGSSFGDVFAMITAPLAMGGKSAQILGTACSIAAGVINLATSPEIQNNPSLAAVNAEVGSIKGQLADRLSTLTGALSSLTGGALRDWGKLMAMNELLAQTNAQWDKIQAISTQPGALNPLEIELWKSLLNAGTKVQNMQWEVDTPGPHACFISTDQFGDFDSQNVPYSSGWFDQLWPGTAPVGETSKVTGCWARYRVLTNAEGQWLAAEAIQQLFVTLGVAPEDVFDGRDGWNLGQISYSRNSFPFYALAYPVASCSAWGQPRQS